MKTVAAALDYATARLGTPSIDHRLMCIMENGKCVHSGFSAATDENAT